MMDKREQERSQESREDIDCPSQYSLEELNALFKEAREAFNHGYYNGSLQSFVTLRKRVEEGLYREHPLYIHAVLSIAEIMDKQGSVREREYLFREALLLVKRLARREGEVAEQIDNSELYLHFARSALSFEKIALSKDFIDRVHVDSADFDRELGARLLLELSARYYDLELDSEAYECFQRASDIASSLYRDSSVHLDGNFYSSLAEVAYLLDGAALSIDLLERALRRGFNSSAASSQASGKGKRLGSKEEAEALHNLGTLKLAEGDLIESGELLRGSLEMKKSLQLPVGDLQSTYAALGYLAVKQSDNKRAEEMFTKVLEIEEEVNSSSTQYYLEVQSERLKLFQTELKKSAKGIGNKEGVEDSESTMLYESSLVIPKHDGIFRCKKDRVKSIKKLNDNKNSDVTSKEISVIVKDED